MPAEEDRQSPAVRTLCDVVRTSLGPFGSNTLLVSESGSVTNTSVGSRVVAEYDADDPEVTLLVQAAEDFATEHGDGTASVVTVAGALLDRAKRLREDGLHPTTIATGYQRALASVTESLADVARPGDAVDPADVARTALTGVRDPHVRTRMAGFLADAADAVAEDADGRSLRDVVSVVTRFGGGRAESRLVEGVLVDEGAAAENMPRRVDGAGVGVLTGSIDVPHADGDEVHLRGGSFDDEVAIHEWERRAFRESLSAAVSAGVDVLVTPRALNDRVKSLVANRGVLVVQHVDEARLDALLASTGATAVPDLDHMDGDAVGRADVRVDRFAGRDMTVFTAREAAPRYTVFCRAPDPRSVDAFSHSVESALAALDAADRGGVVPGGGATEVALARTLRRDAPAVADRSQLAVEAVAEALEVVPRTLADSAGLDPTDALARLRAAHDDGEDGTGVDVLAGEIRDLRDADPVVDPAATRRAVFAAGTELAVQLVRIDDRITAGALD